jgi:hypothetical protein
VLEELAQAARGTGALVVEASVGPPPLNEVAFSVARTLLRALGSARDGEDGSSVAVALRASIQEALLRVRGAHLVLVLDDLDHADRMSLRCLGELLAETPARVRFVASWTGRPGELPVARVAERGLLGIPSPVEGEKDRLVEPLYVEQHLRWRAEAPNETPPRTLIEIVEARLQALPPAQRRALQAVAVAGASSLDELDLLTQRPEGLREAVDELVQAGFLHGSGGTIRLAHVAFGRLVLDTIPAGALAQLHARAADGLAPVPGALELRAHHAIRGRPDFETFMLVEQAAAARARRGDADGEIVILSDAFACSRQNLARGDTEAAASAWHVFGRKLAHALTRAGRLEHAHGILSELLQGSVPGDSLRPAVVEQLAALEELRGRPEEARRLRREAASARRPDPDPSASPKRSRERLKGAYAAAVSRNPRRAKKGPSKS